MVMIVLYTPVVPAGESVAARMFLPCSKSRMTIMRVRKVLSEIEIEKYGRPKLMATVFQTLLSGCEVW